MFYMYASDGLRLDNLPESSTLEKTDSPSQQPFIACSSLFGSVWTWEISPSNVSISAVLLQFRPCLGNHTVKI